MSGECRGAVAVILAVGFAIALLFGGIALAMSQGQAQSCARAGGVWIATDDPEQGGVNRERRCDQ